MIQLLLVVALFFMKAGSFTNKKVQRNVISSPFYAAASRQGNISRAHETGNEIKLKKLHTSQAQAAMTATI